MTYPSLLPPASSPLEKAFEQAAAAALDIPVPITSVWSPEDCPLHMLPWLAWALSVDQWDGDWTEAQKRAAVRASLSVHRRKGTIGAVEAALAALSFDARVQEWFRQTPPADPYTFRLLLEADQVGIGQAGFALLFQVVDRVKNLRSHLSQVQLTVRSRTRPVVVSASGVGSEISLPNFAWRLTVANETTLCLSNPAETVLSISENTICI